MNEQPLKGEYGIPVYRCSTDEQVGSVPAQRKYINHFCERVGLSVLEAIDFEGRTGSDERNINAIADEAIRRKLAGEPVRYLVFYDSTRRARTGGKHWTTVRYRLELHGIEVISATQWTPHKSPGDDLLDYVDAMSARQSSETAANASARNSQLRLLDGKRNHSSRAPFGLDRLYINSNDEPVEIVREHPDGRREVIDAATGDTKDMLEKGHTYDKSDRHRVELIKGMPDRVETVRRIFYLKYIRGLGANRIARILNDESIMSPRGGYWCASSVDHIARNPVYLGRGRANSISQAFYYRQHPEGPRPTGRDVGVPQKVYRPREDWVFREYDGLRGFLPADVREKADDAIDDYLDRAAPGRVPEKKRVKANGRGAWPLSGILIDERIGKPMTGTDSGRTRHRYYTSSSLNQLSKSKLPTKRALIPAEPLERFVLECVEQIVCSLPTLRDDVTAELVKQQAAREKQKGNLPELKKQLTRVEKAIDVQNRMLSRVDDTARVEAELEKLNDEATALGHQISLLGGGDEVAGEQLDEMVSVVIERLEALGTKALNGDRTSLRSLCEVLIEEAVANPETRKVRFKFALPGWAFNDANGRAAPELEPKLGRHPSKWASVTLEEATASVPMRCDKACRRGFKRRGCGSCRRRRDAA
ncbi:MAG: recombinase family protein [Planctomycetota bacterium]